MPRERKRSAFPSGDARADNFSLPGRSRRITVKPVEVPEPIEVPEPEPEPLQEPTEPGGEPVPSEPLPPEEPAEPTPEHAPEKVPA